MSSTTSGRIVGALILLAFVLYGGGMALVNAGTGAPAVLADITDNRVQVSAGALLMLLNSAVVAAIGVVAFPVLRLHHEITAHAYLVTRLFEAVMLAVGVVLLLLVVPLGAAYADAGAGDRSVLASLARVAQEGNEFAYQFAMIGLGLGSVLFCGVLLRARLVPRFLAVWGLIGYPVMAAGMMLDVLGYDVGLTLLVPGALFEVVVGVLLVAKGFPAADHRPPDRLRNGAASPRDDRRRIGVGS